MTHDEKPTSHPADVLALDPIWIPGMIDPVNGADGGVNHYQIHANEGGLLIVLLAYQNMAENDWIDVYWGDDETAVASGLVMAEDLGQDVQLYVASNRVPEGINPLYATVTRTGGGNGGSTPPLNVLVRTLFPGGTDPEPGQPGHQNLLPASAELPPDGIIDEEAAKDGVKVTIDFYINMRQRDVITLAWGGHEMRHTVSEDEMAASSVEILVPESIIRAAGDGEVSLLYRIRDEVHNPSSDWSMPTYVTVEIGEDLFDAPMIENPDPTADPYDVIDLDTLGDDDLLVDVMVYRNGFELGDVVTLTWTGTTAQGLPVTVTPDPQTVTRDPQQLPFIIPNADVRVLGGGHGLAAYTVTRDGSLAGTSRRGRVTFRGASALLPPPFLPDAEGGSLDPALTSTSVVVPGDALQANDDLFVTWHGTRANGSPLVREFHRTISSGNAGRPVTIPVDGASLIAPLNGGSLSVYYRVAKAGSDVELDSERVQVSVGEAGAQLPAASTRPSAVDGVLDPAQIPVELEIVIAPWPGMREGQTVYLLWKGSDGLTHTDDVRISDSSAGREVVLYMDKARVEQFDGQDIELSYWVERDGEPTLYADIARFSVGVAQTGPLPLPRILEAQGSVVNPDDVLEGATVLIEASADLKDYDVVWVRVTSAVSGGSTNVRHDINAGDGGKEVRVKVPWEVIDANAGATFQVKYEVTRSADGSVEPSGAVTYSVASDIGDGPLLILGARFAGTSGKMPPRLISALHRITLVPVMAEWRYDGETQWTLASRWVDDKPWLKLYVRSGSETWECRGLNVFGGGRAFVVIRDEVRGPNGPVTDMKAWGDSRYGGELDDRLSALSNVKDVTSNGHAWAARLADGTVHCWGYPGFGDTPPILSDQHTQVWHGFGTFVGRKLDGGLHAWGLSSSIKDIPAYVHRHNDYIEMRGGSGAMVARRESGYAVAWGDPETGGRMPGQDQYNDIIQLGGTLMARAAVRDNAAGRSVIAWGRTDYGGKVPADIAGLMNIDRIASNTHALCVLLQDGAVRSWPVTSPNGGQMPQSIADLTNILDVSATAYAFCALQSNGQVAAWGHPDYGGKLTGQAAALTNAVQVASTATAFVALCSDGTVVAWGDPYSGGDTSQVADQLTGVVAIYGCSTAFAALTDDGRVVTWGGYGGNSDSVQPHIRGKVTARRLLTPEESAVLTAGSHRYGER